MIIYATRQTIERYKLKMPSEFSDPLIRRYAEDVCQQEKGDALLEWGAKLFYFDHRKCIQVCNFATRLTIVLIDVKLDDLEYLGDAMARYMVDIYSSNKRMVACLKHFFGDHPLVCFSKLTNRRIITSLNGMQTRYLDDGYRLYAYIENGVMQSKKLNRDINAYPVTEKVDGKREYYIPVHKFEEMLLARYNCGV